MANSAKPIQIVFTVTNDLVYDQRMARICSSLSGAGYAVTLVGRKSRSSPPLNVKIIYKQVRLSCFFRKQWMFYAEFNIRLFFYLLFCRADIFCAIDLDTILPSLFASRIRGKKRVYDAHELFCEMKEVVTRPRIYRFWKKIEQFAVPEFAAGYTVSNRIAAEFRDLYNRDYTVIRNMPPYVETNQEKSNEKFILYQGAVNEGRSFETLIPAMKEVPAPLIICGDGNFMQKARELVAANGLQHKVLFKGMMDPATLRGITNKATL
jgi:glycosyltransferase involved in cell wall biosynthesis